VWAGSTRRPRRRSTSESARTAASVGPHRPRRLQARQGHARRDGQRRRPHRRRGRAARLAALARACGPRASSCARSCPSRSAPRTSTTSWATASSRCAGPLPVYVEDPVARLRVVSRRWTA
jgi:hypothetical protein